MLAALLRLTASSPDHVLAGRAVAAWQAGWRAQPGKSAPVGEAPRWQSYGAALKRNIVIRKIIPALIGRGLPGLLLLRSGQRFGG